MLKGIRAGILLAALAAVGGCEKSTRDKDIELISVGEVRELQERVERGDRNLMVLIDPRPAKHYVAGHIPGAINLTLPQVPRDGGTVGELERYQHLVVYGNDPASAQAMGMAKRLRDTDHSGVRLFAGGLLDWRRLGYPVEPATPPAPPAEPANP
jgi:3-mercaptopyruvate sulfurtransferase SseA